MVYLNQTYELLAGGFHAGNKSWNKRHTEIDNCFKLYQLTEGNVRRNAPRGERAPQGEASMQTCVC